MYVKQEKGKLVIRPPKKELLELYFVANRKEPLETYLRQNFVFLEENIKAFSSLRIHLLFGNDVFLGMAEIDDKSSGRYVVIKVCKNGDILLEKRMLKSKWVKWLSEIVTSFPLLTEFDRFQVKWKKVDLLEKKEKSRDLSKHIIISENLKRLLRVKKMTQKELANKSGIRASTVSSYMKLRAIPSDRVLQCMAEVLEVNKSEIDSK